MGHLKPGILMLILMLACLAGRGAALITLDHTYQAVMGCDAPMLAKEDGRSYFCLQGGTSYQANAYKLRSFFFSHKRSAREIFDNQLDVHAFWGEELFFSKEGTRDGLPCLERKIRRSRKTGRGILGGSIKEVIHSLTIVDEDMEYHFSCNFAEHDPEAASAAQAYLDSIRRVQQNGKSGGRPFWVIPSAILASVLFATGLTRLLILRRRRRATG